MRISGFILSLFALSAFSSCKKGSADASPEIVMAVKEYKTNIPLGGVKISLYRCADYDLVFGCRSKSIFATHVTDQNGLYPFTAGEFNRANEGIVLSKFQYWDMGGGEGERFMEPEAIANFTLTTSKSYPDTSWILLETTSELYNRSNLTFKAPKDSTVHFRMFGNETNRVIWTVYTRSPVCYLFCTLNMLDSGSLTLSPKKFETLNATIDY